MTNGWVSTIGLTEDTVYIGGTFTYVGPNTGRGVPIDRASGQVMAKYPHVNGNVFASISDGSGGWYIGGSFTKVGQEMRNNIAHILADGTVDLDWNPNAGGTPSSISALAVSGSTVYVGGRFTSIGGQTRNNAAGLDSATGNATAWNPNADGLPTYNNPGVSALVVSGSTVYVAGAFTSIGGQVRNRIAALDDVNGVAIADWNPNANSLVFSLAVSGSTVYVGGWFTNIGGQERNSLAALNAITGNATVWNPNVSQVSFNPTIKTIAVSGSTVYVGGDSPPSADKRATVSLRWMPSLVQQRLGIPMRVDLTTILSYRASQFQVCLFM